MYSDLCSFLLRDPQEKRNSYFLTLYCSFRTLLFKKGGDNVTSVRFICLAIFIILLCAGSVPASAIIPVYAYRGTVTDLDPVEETLTIEATHQWGCTYEEDDVHCMWREIDPEEMQATVPMTEVYSHIGIGEMVEVTGLPDYSWKGVGLLTLTESGWYMATDLFGDLSYLPAPLVEAYGISFTTYPDCDSCSGSVCSADYASVTITRFGQTKWEGSLAPGEEYTYYDTRDFTSVYIRFLSGEASSSECQDGDFPFSGPQPFSSFIVHIEPSIFAHKSSFILTSYPDGATAYLDGDYVGITPLFISGIDPGQYNLVVEKEGYEPWDDGIMIRERTTSMSIRLRALYGSLDVRSVPSDAEIHVDGIQVGFTPQLIDGVLPGTHTITISKPGYYPAEKTVFVSAGGRSLIYKRLRPGALN